MMTAQNATATKGSSGGATTRVGGYEILSRIGVGGMGAVYKARQVSMDRLVALKILPPRLAARQTYLHRFLREARAAGQLSHPNIVAGIDVGEADGYHYFAMEYVEGETVSAVLAREKRFDRDRTIRILSDVARGLAHAHAHELIHRDVKPQNMLVEKNGNVKLCDLGIARSAEEDANLTKTGAAIGTPYYMSPEQIAGSRDIDDRADIYSLGAVGYHLLAGSPPYEAETATMIMVKHARDDLPSLTTKVPDVDRDLAAVIEKCLEKEPSARYADADQLLEDLQSLAAGRRPAHVKDNWIPRKKTAALLSGTEARKSAGPAPRSSKAVPIIAVASIMVGLGIIYVLLSRSSPKPPEETEIPVELASSVAARDPKPARSESRPDPAPDDRIKRQYEEAMKWVGEHGEEYVQGKRRLLAVKKRARGTEYEFLIDDEIRKIDTRREIAVETAAAELAAKSKALAGQGDYDGAIAVWKGVPRRFRNDLAPRAAAETKSLRTTAEEKIASALGRVEAALKAGEPDKGVEAIVEIANVKFRSHQTRIAKTEKRLKDAVARTEKARRESALAAAKEKFAATLHKVDEALFAGNVAGARDVLSAARKDPDMASKLQSLDTADSIVSSFEAAREAREKSTSALVGKETTVWLANGDRHKGTIQKVTGGAIALKIFITGPSGGTAETVRTFKLTELSTQYRERILPKQKEPGTDGERLAAVLVALSANDPGRAAALLEKVADQPLREHYSEVIKKSK